MKNILCALGLAIGLAAPAWADILRDPPKIEIAAPANAEQVRTAIITAATKRKWQASEVAPGRIEASITVRGRHMVKVAIAYDSQSVAIRYLDSADMDYEAAEGRSYIHGNYIKWTETLAGDIRKQLAASQIAVN
ncbi:hypothetical protein [Jeongeupia sp. USM3]|uniref:hypothetical protein n=1 Tax=Jeongeupia sp. USM3 TaxID=1906741 RepID=UPI00089DFA3E|nr:hypothetical protein [Jeongeupia sp. USM3]AOY01052.1 hypothetical protein BJP62_11730 [Jeongeupia sp. USM3]